MMIAMWRGLRTGRKEEKALVRQRQRNKDGGPIRSVFYLRMSTDKQDLSIGGQRHHLLQFVESDESNDRVVAGEYIDEGITGSTASRANFQRMMADATGPNPPFDEVVIYDLSRFSRDTVDSLAYPRILQAHGIGFHSVKDNFSSDASGRLHMTLIAGVNEFHNYKTAEGSSRGQADATRMGYYTAPRAPLGFLKERVTVGGKEHSILVIDPENAPLVQRIFGMALQWQTPLDIAKTLNAEGIPSPTGNTWSAAVITAMLHNVRYPGTGCHGKRSHSKFLFNSTVTLVPNAHPAIVSQETFDKVQEILTSRRFIPSDPESKHPRRAASPFLLSNLVYCKCCEKKMFVKNSGKGRRKLGCSTNRTRGAGACPTRPEDMEVVETTVLRALLKKVLTEKNLRQVVQKVGEDSKNFAERQGRERETINVELEDIKTQKNNIIQAIAREGRHIPDLATYLDGLSQKEAGLEARKVGLDTERNALQAFLSDELRIIENASRVRTYLQSEDRSVVMSMIESFVKKVELKNGPVTIHYSIPMPPGGNGKKVWSETLPLNGDQWPMEIPAGAGMYLGWLLQFPTPGHQTPPGRG
jgi:DNA invertase Pin-like site-specific DNA recombinase